MSYGMLTYFFTYNFKSLFLLLTYLIHFITRKFSVSKNAYNQISLDYNTFLIQKLCDDKSNTISNSFFLQVIDCCAQQRTYEKFFGLLAQRLSQLKREYIEPFQTIFVDSYNTCHRLEIGKLRNVTKMFAHLLFTDAIGWVVLSVIHLNEHETTSSSRIFIKMLLQVSKGGSVEETLVYMFSPYSKFEFSFPVTLCLPF